MSEPVTNTKISIDSSGLHLVAGGGGRASHVVAAVLILIGAGTDMLAFRNTLSIALPTEKNELVITLMAVGASALGLVAAAAVGILYAAQRRGQDSNKLLAICCLLAWGGLGVMMLLARWHTPTGDSSGSGIFSGGSPGGSPGLIAGLFCTLYCVSGVGTVAEAQRAYHPELSALRRLGKLIRKQRQEIIRLEGELVRARAAIDQLDGDLDREDHRRQAALRERQALGAELANFARVTMAAMLADPSKTGLTETGPEPELPNFPDVA